MILRVLNIGFGSMVSISRIISILNPEAAPIKRIIKNSKDTESLIDATCGRKTQSVIVMDSGHVILSALKTDLLQNRIEKGDNLVGEERF